MTKELKQKELRIKRLTRERKIPYRDMAAVCGLNRTTSVGDKLNMKFEFKISEIMKLKAAYFPEYTVEQLVEEVDVEEQEMQMA